MRRHGLGVRVAGALAVLALSASPARAQHQPRSARSTRSSNGGAPGAAADLPATDLLAHFGAARVDALATSAAANAHLSAILRAREVGTPDSLALIVPLKDHLSFVRGDARLEIALVRTLVDRAEEPEARAMLAEIVATSTVMAKRSGWPTGEDAERHELARRMAAMALASTADPEGPRALVVLLHAGGSIAAAAAMALRAYPPIDRSWSQTLTPDRANLELARATFDLRDVAALEALAARASLVDRVDAPSLPSPSALVNPAKKKDTAQPPLTLGTTERIVLLTALGRFGDARVVGPALSVNARKAAEPPLRIAALEARIAVGGTNVDEEVAALIADDVTVNDGIRLATTLPVAPPLAPIVHALAARLAVTGDEELRARILGALGRMPLAEALDVIAPYARDARVAVDAVNALARSPLPRALDILTELAKAPATRRLALRGYLVRALTRGERSPALDAMVQTLQDAPNADDRALARSIITALADRDATPAATFAALADDPDPRVVRAVLMAMPRSQVRALASVSRDALLHADPTTRALALANLAAVDPSSIAGAELANRVRLGDIDAPMAARALVARAKESDDATLQILASSDDVVNEEALRGYGESHAPDRSGRLADQYLYEANPERRRVLLNTLSRVMNTVAASGSNDSSASTPYLRQTMKDAARLDPDAACRAIARGVRFEDAEDGPETVWLHLQTPSWGPPRAPRPYTGILLSEDARAAPRPVVFDADGDAVIVRVPSGSARLRLAPRVTSYEPPSP